MADQADLMGIFSSLKSDKAALKLYNTYRGVPFNHTASILHVEQGMIATGVHRHQAVSMMLEGLTHLQSSTLPEVIRANVVNVDCRKKQAILGNFTGIGDAVDKRRDVRVQPGDSIEAQISDGRRWIRGWIVNISVSGMCIFTFSESMYALSFGLDRDISVDFSLPGLDSVVHFMGVITNIREREGSYLYRIGLRIFPNPEIKSLLDDFIAMQQQAILREIELEYHTMCQENVRQG